MLDRIEAWEKEEDGYVRKWKLDDLCDLDRNESWFSDMAEKGLFVDHFTRWSVWFRRGRPQKTRYRMDVLSRALTEDELVLYDSCGWHFAALHTEEGFRKDICYYVFQTDENAGVPELYTDPMEQAKSLKRLHGRLRRDVFLMLVFLAVVVWNVTNPRRPDLRFELLVTGEQPVRIYWVFFCLLEIVNSLRGWLNIRRLRRRLTGGEPLDHHADYRKAHRQYVVISGLKLLLAGWFITVIATQVILLISSNNMLPLPKMADFSAVRLEEFYNGTLAENGISGELHHEWTAAGAEIDELRERANEGKTNSILELRTVSIRLPFVWTAEQAFVALLEIGWYKGSVGYYPMGEIAPVETSLADEAWAAAPGEDNWNQFVLLVRDGRQIVMTFYLDRTNGDFDDPAEAEVFRARCTERLLPLLAEELEG
ncbi:DUF2812 domain-containing protein [uncultured Oscillibacter sp.]|uniref:DUF2812 domain-containing protein n=1 Tax=uncultured Oscillibacter sp. TaxID=876091 RepID=UPI0025EEE46B|nr:DUF2812 domain-containing protein [uncultured Oscillibacter sp.]